MASSTMMNECAQCTEDNKRGELTIHYHPTPACHDRPMLAVKNPQNSRIWWCADCHNKLPREVGS